MSADADQIIAKFGLTGREREHFLHLKEAVDDMQTMDQESNRYLLSWRNYQDMLIPVSEKVKRAIQDYKDQLESV